MRREPNTPDRAGLTDYDVYVMKPYEKLFYMLLAAGALFAVGYIFYQSIILSAILSVLALWYPKLRVRQIIEKRKKQLSLQFKDLLYSLSSSLSAGKGIENSFAEAQKQLRLIYPDEDTFIIQELQIINRSFSLSVPIEEILSSFAERAHLEDVYNFVDVFNICNRLGGNLVQVIASTSSIISEKIEIKRDIETTISGKKFENRVLMAMPIFLVGLLSATAADFMEPVFHTIMGRVVMTFAIVLFMAAFFMGEKIMQIEV